MIKLFLLASIAFGQTPAPVATPDSTAAPTSTTPTSNTNLNTQSTIDSLVVQTKSLYSGHRILPSSNYFITTISGNGTNRAVGPCVASTGTFTTNGNPIQLTLEGYVFTGGTGDQVNFQFLLDGKKVCTQNLAPVATSASGSISMVCSVAASAGAHSACVSLWNSNGTWTLGGLNSFSGHEWH